MTAQSPGPGLEGGRGLRPLPARPRGGRGRGPAAGPGRPVPRGVPAAPRRGAEERERGGGGRARGGSAGSAQSSAPASARQPTPRAAAAPCARSAEAAGSKTLGLAALPGPLLRPGPASAPQGVRRLRCLLGPGAQRWKARAARSPGSASAPVPAQRRSPAARGSAFSPRGSPARPWTEPATEGRARAAGTGGLGSPPQLSERAAITRFFRVPPDHYQPPSSRPNPSQLCPGEHAVAIFDNHR